MDPILLVIGVLVGIIAFQQFQIQKLVDKLMSRSFTEYQAAKKSSQGEIAVPAPPEVPEDLRALQEFKLLG